MLACPKCSKEFKSKGSLNTHIKTVCSDNPEMFTCEHCLSNFNRKSSLNSHLQICSAKKERDTQQMSQSLTNKNKECEELKKLLQEKDEEYTSSILKKEQELKFQLTKIEEEYKAQFLKKEEEYKKQTERSREYYQKIIIDKDNSIIELKAKLKSIIKSKDEYKELVSKTITKSTNTVNITTNNQTFNNLIVDHLKPITDDLMKEIGEKVSITSIKSGAIGIANAVKPLLEDKIVRSDETRNTLAYNYNGVPKKDPKGLKLSTQIIESTMKTLEKYADEIELYYDSKNEKGELVGSELEKSIAFGQYRRNMTAKRFKTEGKKLAKRIADYAMSKLDFDLKYGITKNQEYQTEGLQLSDIPPNCVNYTYKGKDYNVVRWPSGEVRRLIRLKSTGEPMETDDETESESDSEIDEF